LNEDGKEIEKQDIIPKYIRLLDLNNADEVL
jgi:hypothetical protein